MKKTKLVVWRWIDDAKHADGGYEVLDHEHSIKETSSGELLSFKIFAELYYHMISNASRVVAWWGDEVIYDSDK